MSSVVKVGGRLLEKPAIAAQAAADAVKPPMVIVHGGGMQITRMLERMNVTSSFIEGLRVTDEQTLDAVANALLGEVHTKFVAALRGTGLNAVGVFGVIAAHRKTGPWGFVGANVTADATALNLLLAAGMTPVVATLGVGTTPDDSLLNVNGDETAAAVAVAIKAGELVFLTDVEGVRDAGGVTMDRVNHPDELLGKSFVTGGMIPKLRAVRTAMEGGVGTVRVGRTLFGGVVS
jgi:acetylglutamate kinase